MIRNTLRRLIDWAQTAPRPVPPPPLTPQQEAELSALKAQYWQWELEGFKHIIVIAAAGLAGAVALGGAGFFKGQGNMLMWSINGFAASLLFAHLAIYCGARAFEFAIQPSKSGAPKPAGRPSMLVPTIVGGVSAIALVLGVGFMYFGALDGLIKLGQDGAAPAPDKTKYTVHCTSIEGPASAPAARTRPSNAAQGKASTLTCQISS